MNSKTKIISGIVAFSVFLVVATIAYKTLSVKVAPPSKMENEQAENEEATKTKAPEFTVMDGDGKEVKLSSFIGKPVVLNFWASWCPPCKAEMPEFDKVYKELGNEVTFMMVDMVDGQRETLDKGKKHIADNAFAFPVYYDTKQNAASVYNVASLPTTYFIDKEGYIVTGAQGAINETSLREGIDMITKTSK